jgi:hypothetical protein
MNSSEFVSRWRARRNFLYHKGEALAALGSERKGLTGPIDFAAALL